MLAIARMARNSWEDAAVADKFKEVEQLGLGEPRSWSMGYVQIDDGPGRFGLTMVMDDVLLHFPVAVWPQKPTGEEGFVAMKLDDVAEAGRVGFRFILRSPRRSRATVRLCLQDGSTWSLAMADPSLKRAISERLGVGSWSSAAG